MIKTVTSTTTFDDAIGKRISITYSEIDEETGQVISDNKRVDRILTDKDAKSAANLLAEYAQNYIDALPEEVNG